MLISFICTKTNIFLIHCIILENESNLNQSIKLCETGKCNKHEYDFICFVKKLVNFHPNFKRLYDVIVVFTSKHNDTVTIKFESSVKMDDLVL